ANQLIPQIAWNVPKARPRLFIETTPAIPARRHADCAPVPTAQQAIAPAAAAAVPRNPSGSASSETRVAQDSILTPQRSNIRPIASPTSPSPPIAAAYSSGITALANSPCRTQ